MHVQETRVIQVVKEPQELKEIRGQQRQRVLKETKVTQELKVTKGRRGR